MRMKGRLMTIEAERGTMAKTGYDCVLVSLGHGCDSTTSPIRSFRLRSDGRIFCNLS